MRGMRDYFMFRNKNIELPIQHNSMSERIRNKIWSAISITIFRGDTTYSLDKRSNEQVLIHCIIAYCINNLAMDFDNIPSINRYDITDSLRLFFKKEWFDAAEWYNIYDFMEWIAHLTTSADVDNIVAHIATELYKQFNFILNAENSAYRFVEGFLVENVDESQIHSIENAYNIPIIQCQGHIKQAIVNLSRKPNPNYIGCAVESIHSLEAFARIVCDNHKTLGENTDELTKTLKLHGALGKSLSNLYGFSSDVLRHADKADPVRENYNNSETAIFMLVTCSSWLNYLNALYEKSKAAEPVEIGS